MVAEQLTPAEDLLLSGKFKAGGTELETLPLEKNYLEIASGSALPVSFLTLHSPHSYFIGSGVFFSLLFSAMYNQTAGAISHK